MHVHILGICGTFMGGIARLAMQLGHKVTGMDANVYPPMSTQLEALGVELIQGFAVADLPQADCYIIGNAMSRGNPAVEAILEQRLPYTSGPAWLGEHLLKQRHVFAVAGTHGKTTTASLLTHILRVAGKQPGYLIGGVVPDFAFSADLGAAPFFVVEADEYDTAFFDKRSKFLHYHPQTFIINNLEFDHADIFPDLAAIQRQFAHALRLVPQTGQVLYPAGNAAIAEVLAQGCWSQQVTLGLQAGAWQTRLSKADGSEFEVLYDDQCCGQVQWSLLGEHNVLNALAAIVASAAAGVDCATACAALATFQGIKRRLEVRGRVNNITVYDDFAHHPTAITTTLQGLREHVQQARIIAVVDFGSNTMQAGVHDARIRQACAAADEIIFANTVNSFDGIFCSNDAQAIIDHVTDLAQAGDHIVVMSNKGFANIHQRLLDVLGERYAVAS